MSAALAGTHVHESGTPGSPAVVFLHGAGARGRMWREHMARLTGFHCLAPDLPGFGCSDHVAFLARSVTADVVAEAQVGRGAHVIVAGGTPTPATSRGIPHAGGVPPRLRSRRACPSIRGVGAMSSPSGSGEAPAGQGPTNREWYVDFEGQD